MKRKKLVVEKSKFDAVLSALLKSPPIPARKIKGRKKRAPAPIFKPSAS
jgi:hypothetical protein